MLELLSQLTEKEIAILATGFGTFVASIMITLRGVKKGKPTSAAVAGAIAAASCRASDLTAPITHLREDLERIAREMETQRAEDSIRHREIITYLVKLEDRTTRS